MEEPGNELRSFIARYADNLARLNPLDGRPHITGQVVVRQRAETSLGSWPGLFYNLLQFLEGVDIHLVQMNALTRLRMDRNALGVWS